MGIPSAEISKTDEEISQRSEEQQQASKTIECTLKASDRKYFSKGVIHRRRRCEYEERRSQVWFLSRFEIGEKSDEKKKKKKKRMRAEKINMRCRRVEHSFLRLFCSAKDYQ